ncbi:hypothetical protein QVD17_02559 [Tagetes erecta]|uniref:Phospholipase-like protein n=1 Tax=Tagetes erecta TaxID=13708 RepID=A0AAD8L8G1_TARER|nr:hypothetical protein QVD17_02559 [Tagetes erecta]
MADLKFCDGHNICACLDQTNTTSTDYYQLIDFLTTSKISHAITANPSVYENLIRDFWGSANADETAVTTTIRAVVAGISDLSGGFDYRQVLKCMLSYNWRYLVHICIHCLSSRKGGLDAISSQVASAVVALVMNEPFNFSNLVFQGMVSNIEGIRRSKFLLYPRFLQMIINVQLPDLRPHGNTLSLKHMTKLIFNRMKSKSPRSTFSGTVTPFFGHIIGEGNGNVEVDNTGGDDDAHDGANDDVHDNTGDEGGSDSEEGDNDRKEGDSVNAEISVGNEVGNVNDETTVSEVVSPKGNKKHDRDACPTSSSGSEYSVPKKKKMVIKIREKPGSSKYRTPGQEAAFGADMPSFSAKSDVVTQLQKTVKDLQEQLRVKDGENLIQKMLEDKLQKQELWKARRPHCVKTKMPTTPDLFGLSDHIKDRVEVGKGSSQSNIICVQGYKVKRSAAPILESIFKKHGDIAAKCAFKSAYMRSSFLETICEVVSKIQTNNNIGKMEEIEQQMLIIEAANINVSWLRTRLNAAHKRKEEGKKCSLLMEIKANTVLVKRAAQMDMRERCVELVAAEDRFEKAERCVKVLHLVEKNLSDGILKSKANIDSWARQLV